MDRDEDLPFVCSRKLQERSGYQMSAPDAVQFPRASVSDEIPDHTTPSYGDILAFFWEEPQSAGPYDAGLFLAYKSDDLQYTRKFIKEGQSCYDPIFSDLVTQRPNWIRFLIEYLGLDYDSERRIYHHSVLKLSHLRQSCTNDDHIKGE